MDDTHDHAEKRLRVRGVAEGTLPRGGTGRQPFFRAGNKLLWGYIFILPSIIGFFLFYVGPMLFSLGVSLTQWDIITPMQWAGLRNYIAMLHDPLVSKALLVTLYYTALSVPLVTFTALLIALLLNAEIRGKSVFRTIFYLPSIVPLVANTALWMFLYNPMFGFFNSILRAVHLPSQTWIYGTYSVIPSIVLMTVWGSGTTVIIYLAGLQGLPRELYEAAEIDGARPLRRFFSITMPLMSPIIFYNLVLTTIGSLQTFAQAYIMTEGGPNNASLFYMLLLYRTAFKNQRMGYASAMAWVLFVIIGLLTILVFRSSRFWVFYEGDKNG
jgi:multiple sugar transport system permease protein